MNISHYFMFASAFLLVSCAQTASAPTEVQQEGLDPTTIQAQILSGSTLSQ